MTRVKICGVTRAEDAATAVEAGADAVGFNFFPGSARYIDAARAASLVAVVSPRVEAVGVFVNASIDDMRDTAERLKLAAAQWHGDGPPIPHATSHRQYVAFRVQSAEHIAAIHAYVETCRGAGHLPAAILVDARVEGQYGGTGQLAPWHLLDGFDPGVPWILAGGLTPDNVEEAVIRLHPWMVDVAGGVEIASGIKDARQMRQFIAAVRCADEKSNKNNPPAG